MDNTKEAEAFESEQTKNVDGAQEAEYTNNERVGTDAWMKQQATIMYTKSTDYLNANLTNQWERNIAHFNSEHAPGSDYARNPKRSRIFRPKTRSNIKAQEAKMLIAMFGSRDLIVVEAENSTDPQQTAAARINKFILQYRMEKRMPWTLTAVGAFQDTKVYGVCFSHQYWAYEVDENIEPALHEDGTPILGNVNGKPTPMGRKERIIRKDDLCCDLIEPENFRFDPMADWRDPVNDSPYIVYMMPIYVGDALEKMQNIDPKTQQPFWKPHSKATILATRSETHDRTRQAREGRKRQDPAQQEEGNNFTTVWAHMNVMRINGEDQFWWTIGTEIVVTEMRRLRDAYPWLMQNERPFTMGISTLEAHKNYPASDTEQGAGLQEEINQIANQRMDNVKLVLNKRYFVRRGSQTDLDALMRNVSGGGVMMNDPERDVKVVDTRDVTGSSYQEQDRLSVEHDELLGSFSQSSVQSNSNMNQSSKYGFEAMGTAASVVQDYGLSLFVLTWVEKTIGQLIRLIQMYETDETILALAAQDAELFQRFGQNEITDDLLRKQLTVSVDVGIGNTDPLKRVERLAFGIQQVLGLPGMIDRIKSEDISDEIWAALGYRNGSRFFRDEEEQAQYLEQNPPSPPPEIEIKKEELAIRQEDNKMRHEREMKKIEQEAGMRSGENEAKVRQEADNSDRKVNLEREKIRNQREIEAAKIAANQMSQVRQIAAGGGRTS